jgi:hypothetical protein
MPTASLLVVVHGVKAKIPARRQAGGAAQGIPTNATAVRRRFQSARGGRGDGVGENADLDPSLLGERRWVAPC